MAPPLLDFAAAALVSAGVIALVATYRRKRYWERKALLWQRRLKAQVWLLRSLIREGREAQESYRAASDPSRLHADFVRRCDTALQDHFGEAYVTRVARRMSEDSLQPPGLASDEHIFAWYDTERRIAALHDLLNETADDFASI